MTGSDQLERVRRICLQFPEAEERLSHGEPTFFARKRVFAMFASNHHNDGRVAVWLPCEPDVQEMLIGSAPEKFFRPPYVGHRGWIGVELDQISDEELTFHITEGWRLVAPKRLIALMGAKPDGIWLPRRRWSQNLAVSLAPGLLRFRQVAG